MSRSGARLVSADDFSRLASLHTLGDEPIPAVVLEVAAGADVELVGNELGGLTFRFDDHYVKWSPRRTGIDLERERYRLRWISSRHRQLCRDRSRLVAADRTNRSDALNEGIADASSWDPSSPGTSPMPSGGCLDRPIATR